MESFHVNTASFGIAEADKFSGDGSGLTNLSATVSETSSYLSQPGTTEATVPYWKGGTLQGNSPLFISESFVAIGRNDFSSATPEPLTVFQTGSAGNTIAEFQNDIDDYAQIKIENPNQGLSASIDYVGEVSDNVYVDVGINGVNYSDPAFGITGPSDSYVYAAGGNLVVGTKDSYDVVIHVGGTQPQNEVARVSVANGFVIESGSLQGTASHALTADVASTLIGSVESASHATYAETAGVVLTAKTASSVNLDNGAFIKSDITSNAPSWNEGLMFWDKTNHCWAYYNDSSEVTIQIGQETVVHALAGENIANGDAVYIGDEASVLPVVFKAIADLAHDKHVVLGIATNTFSSGSTGWITVNGRVNGLDTSTFPAGSPLWLSTTTLGGYQLTEPQAPYPRTRIGTCVYQDSTEGKLLVRALDLPDAANAYAGPVTPIVIADGFSPGTSSNFIYVSTASVNLANSTDKNAVISLYNLQSASLEVGNSSNYYIYADYNNGSPQFALTTNIDDINSMTKVFIATTYRADDDAHWVICQETGLALANKLEQRLIDIYGFVRDTGFSLNTSGSGYVTVTAGECYLGVNQVSSVEFNSGLPLHEMHYFYHSASAWTQYTRSLFVNSEYDDGTNVHTISSSYYVTNYIWRLMGEANYDTDCVVIVGNQYETLDAAKAAPIPSDIPLAASTMGLLVGRIIAQSGSYVAADIGSSFSEVFTSGAPTQHNSLGGLQGGSADQYYHLTSTQYSNLGVSASYASTAGVATTSTSASHALVADSTVSSSFATNALTASYVLNRPIIKSGAVSGSLFTGNPKVYTVTFTSAFPTGKIYTPSVIGEVGRTWIVSGVSNTGFTINGGNNTAPTGFVYWSAIETGEF